MCEIPFLHLVASWVFRYSSRYLFTASVFFVSRRRVVLFHFGGIDDGHGGGGCFMATAAIIQPLPVKWTNKQWIVRNIVKNGKKKMLKIVWIIKISWKIEWEMKMKRATYCLLNEMKRNETKKKHNKYLHKTKDQWHGSASVLTSTQRNANDTLNSN